VTGETIALDAGAVDVDATAFARLAGAGDGDSLAHAVDLYRGDFLEGFAFRGTLFEDWLMAERERLRELALEALARLLAQQRREGAAGPALRTALRLLAVDPLQESVHRTAMRLYAELGRRGSALHQYQVCLGILQTELAVEPEAETRQLYQEILTRPPALHSPDASDGSSGRATLRGDVAVLTSEGPLVGRGPEMARLQPVVVTGGDRGRVIVLVGEAGVGKTRLVSELAADAHSRRRRVLTGRCHESEQILPFGPWLAILRAAWRLAGDGWLPNLPLPMRRELGRFLPELWSGDGSEASAADFLILFESVSQLLAHVAGEQPTLLILEDLHWGDEMSARLLAFIGRRLASWPVVMVATAREEDLVDAPLLRQSFAELEREAHVETVALRPLSREHTADLVRALTRAGTDERTVARLSEEVWRTSGGNPFVVVEAMRAAAHEGLAPGLGAKSVPERVRDLIRRQLERLDVPSRDLMALASVVGREFDFGLLHRASGLGEEVVAGGVEALIRRRVFHSVGERFDFCHDRVREVAYDQMLGPRRTALHRRVVEAMETADAGDPERHHLALGLHCFAGEVWDKAVHHLRQAGRRALERFAKREAVVCFERALTALGHLAPDRSTLELGFDLRLELRPALNQLGEIPRVLACLREAGVLAEQLDDPHRRGRVLAFLSVAHGLLGELDDAVATSAHAREIAERIGDLKLRLLATDVLVQARYQRGEYERVVEQATDNLAVLPADWVGDAFGRFAPTSIYDRVFLVRSLGELGRFDEAARYVVEAIQLAESTRHAYAIGMAHCTGGTLDLARGEWARARTAIERGLAALRTADAVLSLPSAVASGAWVLGELGEEAEPLRLAGEGEQLVQDLETRPIAVIRACLALGRAYLRLGRPHDARRLGHRALACAPTTTGDAAHALHLRCDIAMHPDAFDPERGAVDYHRALALAASRGMRPLVAHCHLGLGRLHRRVNGRSAAEEEHLTVAATMYRDMNMAFWLKQAEATEP
jgi:tetratricopeptide (TPR) repeat protein